MFFRKKRLRNLGVQLGTTGLLVIADSSREFFRFAASSSEGDAEAGNWTVDPQRERSLRKELMVLFVFVVQFYSRSRFGEDGEEYVLGEMMKSLGVGCRDIWQDGELFIELGGIAEKRMGVFQTCRTLLSTSDDEDSNSSVASAFCTFASAANDTSGAKSFLGVVAPIAIVLMVKDAVNSA